MVSHNPPFTSGGCPHHPHLSVLLSPSGPHSLWLCVHSPWPTPLAPETITKIVYYQTQYLLRTKEISWHRGPMSIHQTSAEEGEQGAARPEVTLPGKNQLWERGAVRPPGPGWGVSGRGMCEGIGERRRQHLQVCAVSSKWQRGLLSWWPSRVGACVWSVFRDSLGAESRAQATARGGGPGAPGGSVPGQWPQLSACISQSRTDR